MCLFRKIFLEERIGILSLWSGIMNVYLVMSEWINVIIEVRVICDFSSGWSGLSAIQLLYSQRSLVANERKAGQICCTWWVLCRKPSYSTLVYYHNQVSWMYSLEMSVCVCVTTGPFFLEASTVVFMWSNGHYGVYLGPCRRIFQNFHFYPFFWVKNSQKMAQKWHFCTKCWGLFSWSHL